MPIDPAEAVGQEGLERDVLLTHEAPCRQLHRTRTRLREHVRAKTILIAIRSNSFRTGSPQRLKQAFLMPTQ